VVEKYLAHVEECPFHAALEHEETESIQQKIEVAQSLSGSRQLPLTREEGARVLDIIEHYIKVQRGEKKISAVLLRGRGMEDKLLDLSRRKEQISFNVAAPCSIQVLTSAGDSGQELLLATHVINAIPHRDVGPIQSRLNLPGNQSLNFETRPLGGTWFQVAITTGKFHKATLGERLRVGSLVSWLRMPIPRIIITAVAVGILAWPVVVWLNRQDVARTDSQVQIQMKGNAGEAQNHNTTSPDITSQDTTGSAPPFQVRLNDDGGTIGLDASGKLQGIPPGLSPQDQRLVETALRVQEIVVSRLPKEMKAETDDRMGSSNALTPFTLIGPVQKIVLTTTPKFTWNPLAGADSYNVKLFDGAYHYISESGPLTTNSWVVPRSQALAPGKVYVWKVVAAKDGVEVSSNTPAKAAGQGGLSEAKFKVLETTKAREVNRVRKAYGKFHLLMGITYARAGLLDEAELEFNALLRANPQSKVAQELLNRVRAARSQRD
jgi:hypothetical protein